MSRLFQGRKKPYLTGGIHRVPCARCGAPSKYQWQVCANGNYYLGVCADCDIGLNHTVLTFFKLKNRRALLRRYRERVGN